MAAPAKLTLLDLPLELKQQIYKEVLLVDYVIWLSDLRHIFNSHLCDSVSLLLTSRQCYSEASPVFWAINTFNIGKVGFKNLDAIATTIGETNCLHVRRLTKQIEDRLLLQYTKKKWGIQKHILLFPSCRTLDLVIEICHKGYERLHHISDVDRIPIQLRGLAAAFDVAKCIMASYPSMTRAVLRQPRSVFTVNFVFVDRNYKLEGDEAFIDINNASTLLELTLRANVGSRLGSNDRSIGRLFTTFLG